MKRGTCTVDGCGAPEHARGMCGRHYLRNLKYGTPTGGRDAGARENPQVRFDRHVDRNGPVQPHMGTPCWLWTARRNKRGYGVVGTGGHEGTALAHRFAWFLAHGDMPEKHVLHRCDVPACVRIDHLFLGTDLDNVRDMDAKGRRGKAVGAAHPRSKLTRDAVVEMRALHATTGATAHQLAPRYGVTPQSIDQVLRRITWKHI